MAKAGADRKHPDCDIELTDGHDSVGLMLVNSRGFNDPLAIQRSPYPRTSTKINSGTGKYDDLELPYKTIAQDDWIGGRAGLNFEDDVTRYMDNFRAWTDQSKQICCGPQERYCTDFDAFRDSVQVMPGNVVFTSLIGSESWLRRGVDSSITPSTSNKVAVILKRVGTPTGKFMVCLIINGEEQFRSFVEVADFPEGVSQLVEIELQNSDLILVEEEILVGHDFWIYVSQYEGTPTAENHWEVGVSPDTNTTNSGTDSSLNGLSKWTHYAKGLYYRFLDDNIYDFRYFEYKRSIYAVDKKSGRIFLNGDRGTADSNIGVLTRLVDTTKLWTANEWKDCKVLITKGAGASDKQPWRNITGNGTNYLTVSPAWDTVHSPTTTEYVILGSNSWKNRDNWAATITDIAVAGDYYYLAFENTGLLVRCREDNVAGVWTYDYHDESIARANKLRAIYTPDGWELWGSLDDHSKNGSVVWKAKVPVAWGTSSSLYNLVSVLDDGKGVWDEQVVNDISVSQDDNGMKISVGAGFSIGDMCSKEIPVTDITKGNKLGMMVKSSIALASGDLKLKLDDTPLLGRGYIPDNVWHYDTEVSPSKAVHFRSEHRPTSVYWYDASQDGKTTDKWNKYYNAGDSPDVGRFNVVLAKDDDFLYISSSEPMKSIYFLIANGSTKTNAMKFEFFNGRSWTSLTHGNISDGTNGFMNSGWVTPIGSTILWNPGSISASLTTNTSITPETVSTGTSTSATEVDGDGDSTTTGTSTNTTPAVTSTSDSVTEPAQASYLPADNWNCRISLTTQNSDTITFEEILCLGSGYSETPETDRFVDMRNTYEDTFSANEFTDTYYDLSSIYVGYTSRFNRIKVKMGTLPNSVAGTLLAYYFNGGDWIRVTITDGTIGTAGKTLSQTDHQFHDVTFTMPTDWQKGCLDFEQEALTNDYFYIKLVINVTSSTLYNLTDDINIQKIALEDDGLEDLFKYTALDNVKDGNAFTHDYIRLTSDDYLYIMYSSKYNGVYFTIADGNSVDGNGMTMQYFDGHQWMIISASDYDFVDGTIVGSGGTARTLGQSGLVHYTIPHNWQEISVNNETGYAVRLLVSEDLYHGSNEPLRIREIYVQNDDATELSVPALEANIWNYVEIPISPNANPNPDDSKIVSIGTYMATNKARAYNIIIGMIDLITSSLKYFKLGIDRINAIEAYGDVVVNPWIFTESTIYEIQTQNENAVVAMPLREIQSLRSETNGVAHTVSDVYLVFNLGQYIQKYYQHNLDDVGPNRDEGLPSNRQGDPTCLLSYPGRIFLSLDAKTTGYSTIMLRREGGWHEIYRAPYGCPIHDMIIQVIPGMSTRLWVSQEYDILWLRLPTDTWNPKNDSDFRFTHESVITTGWMTAGFMDVLKFWKSVKIYSENLSGTSQYIQCEYQLEDGDLESGWLALDDTFDTSPFQEELVSNNYDVNARRIRFRYKLITSSNLESPIMKASVIETLLRFPVKYSYAFTYRLEDNPENYTGVKTATRAEDVAEILDAWGDKPTVLNFYCNYSPFDDKKVVIEPSSLRPIQVDSTDVLYEKHIGSVTLLEI